MKEEFKAFVRKRPELVRFVNKGDMTWQKFYEMWALYGEDEKVWKDYDVKGTEQSVNASPKEESFSFSSLMDSIKKVDMNAVQKGIGSLQKAIELLQGLTTKGATNNTNTYEPRQLFKKFED